MKACARSESSPTEHSSSTRRAGPAWLSQGFRRITGCAIWRWTCRRLLERARRRAPAPELDQIKLVEGDAEHIPLADGSVDLFLSYWGLHCMLDPMPPSARSPAARGG
jgi:hypothetical protein